jgi:DNA-binding beta-propeller fold protein YncE
MPRSTGGARRLAGALAIAGVVVGASGCSDDGGDGGGEEVGALDTVVESDSLVDADDVAAGGGRVWVALEDGQVVAVEDDDVEPVTALDAVSTDATIAAGSDGSLIATDRERQQLLRYRDGQVDAGRVPALQELSELAAGPDGSVLVGDYEALQLVALGADGTVEELVDRVLAGPMTSAPDGTLYYVEDQLFDGRIMVMRPGRGPARLTQSVDRDDEGNAVEPPSEGAVADDSYIDARDLAATDDGLYVLTFTNEVWRIGEDEELELVLRRGDDSTLAALSAADGDVYVLDAATGTLSTIAL